MSCCSSCATNVGACAGGSCAVGPTRSPVRVGPWAWAPAPARRIAPARDAFSDELTAAAAAAAEAERIAAEEQRLAEQRTIDAANIELQRQRQADATWELHNRPPPAASAPPAGTVSTATTVGYVAGGGLTLAGLAYLAWKVLK